MGAVGAKRVYRVHFIGSFGAKRVDRAEIQGLGILTFRLVRGGGGMADALVSGASVRKDVEVQLLSAAPRPIRPRSRAQYIALLVVAGHDHAAKVRLTR